MNEPTSRIISVKAIEDIIQIQKLLEDAPNLKSVQFGKEKCNERVIYSVLKNDFYSPEAANDCFKCILKECEVGNSFKCNDKICRKMEMNGWEADCSLTKYINPEVVLLENVGILEGTGSDPDVKCWSSDSDVTVLRVKKEFRNELSNKVEWEEQRNLGDDVSLSSANLDWESHSLINLAGVLSQEKDVHETLTPFTIWSKVNGSTNSSVVLMENVGAGSFSEPSTPKVRLAVEGETEDPEKMARKLKGRRENRFKRFFGPLFECFAKKKSLRKSRHVHANVF